MVVRGRRQVLTVSVESMTGDVVHDLNNPPLTAIVLIYYFTVYIYYLVPFTQKK